MRQPSEVNIISVITGSGKTWLAVHVMNNNIASRILIIVPDTLLLDQMETFMANLGGFFDYTIATIA